MSGLDCETCGCKLHLEYRNKIVRLKSGREIGFAKAPMLVCGGCGSRYIPYMTNILIKQVCECEEENKVDDTKETSDRRDNGFQENEDEIEIWYDFDKIKYAVFDKKFISEKVKFIYDKDDYYFIPGLIREWKIGFLTPVFFNIEVLLKYMYHPDYGLDIGADTFGYIYKGDEHYIT